MNGSRGVELAPASRARKYVTRAPVDEEMKLGMRLRWLWRMRIGAAICALIALFAAVASVQRISLAPPSMSPRSFEMATAATHVVIDTPSSVLLDLRQDTYSIEALTTRAVLLGNVMATAPVRRAIAKRANVPLELLRVEPPLTSKLPQGRPVDGNQRRTSDIVRSTDQYRINIQSNPTVPILDIYAQSPTAESAAALANAAVAELHAYLEHLAATENIPPSEQITLVDLGRAEGTVINPGIRWQVALFAFLITFSVAAATLLFLSRVRAGWVRAARAERLAAS